MASAKRSSDRLHFLRFDHRSYFDRKRLVRFSLLLVALWLGNTFFLGDQSVFTLLQLKRENSALRGAIAHAEATVDSLRTMAERLRSDPSMIERVARERYRMVRDDEKQYLFIDIPESEKERLVEEVRAEEVAAAKTEPEPGVQGGTFAVDR